MENNVYQNPSYQIYQDPNADYMVKANEFLKKAIISCAISSLPIGSIIAMCMASKNRAALLDYLSRGGLHTIRIKFASALSRGGKYAGLGFTIFWAVYGLIFLIYIIAIITALVATSRS